MTRPSLDRMVSAPIPQQHSYALRSVTTLPEPDNGRAVRRKVSMWNLFKRRAAVEDALPSPRDAFRMAGGNSGRVSPSPSMASTVQTQSSAGSNGSVRGRAQAGDLFGLAAEPRISTDSSARVLRSTKSHYNLRTNRSVIALDSWDAAEFETAQQVSWVTATGRRQIGLCD